MKIINFLTLQYVNVIEDISLSSSVGRESGWDIKQAVGTGQWDGGPSASLPVQAVRCLQSAAERETEPGCQDHQASPVVAETTFISYPQTSTCQCTQKSAHRKIAHHTHPSSQAELQVSIFYS